MYSRESELDYFLIANQPISIILWLIFPLSDMRDSGGSTYKNFQRTPPPSFVFAYIFTKKCPRWRSTPPPNGSTCLFREILDPPLHKINSCISEIAVQKHLLNSIQGPEQCHHFVLSVLLKKQHGFPI